MNTLLSDTVPVSTWWSYKNRFLWTKKQRILGILESEYNQNDKYLERGGMNNAMKLNKIAKE